VRLLLDEHRSPGIAHRLAARGHDVTSVRDRGLLGKEDRELLAWCRAHGYTVCTENAKDFFALHHHGHGHSGILIVAASWSDAELFESLRILLEESQMEDLRDQLIVVPSP